MSRKRLIQRSSNFDTSPKRYCQVCGDPLGSTEALCHDCGGRSFRGVRDRSAVTPIPNAVRAALGSMFGGR